MSEANNNVLNVYVQVVITGLYFKTRNNVLSSL